MGWRIGIDSGGTFTDMCLFNVENQIVQTWKVPSTPDDPSRGIAAALVEGLAHVGASVDTVDYIGHGTTVGTNALIQHRGAKTGLITTDGFADLLEIGRQTRPDLYNLKANKPAQLVSRDLRYEVRERVLYTGDVEISLDTARLREVVRELREAGVGAIAVSFLYSFMNSEHEMLAKQIIQEEYPEAFVTVSHEVAPEFREFERLSTAVVNSYLGPTMQRYIVRLGDRFRDLGVSAKLHLTQSNGGVTSFDAAGRFPVRTVLSGPSTGVVAAQQLGGLAGYDNLITFDMGGTSSDVALLAGGVCQSANETVVHGYPIKAPMLDIHTVGAGGGSIAYVDSGGLLKVGPASAGAYPGPACYGNGTEEATVTDANVVLGLQNPRELLGGRMKIDADLSRAAVARLGERLGLDIMGTADGILAIVTANMAKAIRVISVQRGHDPRDYTLLAFGGAGPLHAARLATELDIGKVLVPRHPGILCAAGLLLTDLRTDFAATRLLMLEDGVLEQIFSLLDILRARCDEWFQEEGVAAGRRRLRFSLDMRYVGQNYELSIPFDENADRATLVPSLAEAFAEAHRMRYGFAADGEPIQIVTARVEATGVVSKADLPAARAASGDVSWAVIGQRDIWLADLKAHGPANIYDRTRLEPGHRIEGPALVEQMDATTFVPRGMIAEVDDYLNLVLRCK